MYVIDVIPLSRTAPGVLSYRSTVKLSVGSIVHIPIRKTVTQGIVIEVQPVSEAKEMLKRARFLLSKSTPSTAGMLPSALMHAAEKTAEYHATSVGSVLSAVFSEYIRLGVSLPTLSFEAGTEFVREAVELPIDERIAFYEKKIAAVCFHNKAVVFVAPTQPELLFWKEVFKNYSPLILSGSLTGKRREQALTNATNHTGLVIATPNFSWVPVTRLGLIIADRVSAGTYTLPKRPYLSMTHALEALAEARAIPYILGDLPLPLELRAKPMAPLQKTSGMVTLIDARKPIDETQEHVPAWSVIPENVLARIKDHQKTTGITVVLTSRKGYAPAVVCRDCGQAQTDERGVPLSFSIAGGERVLLSSDGVSRLDAKRLCPRCGSWNLLPLGIGSERVEEALRAAFPEVLVSPISAELLSSPSRAKKAFTEAWQPGNIIVGTEALIPWLYLYTRTMDQKPLGVIASADSLLALPFWRSRERFVRLSCMLRDTTSEVLLVTRHPEDSAVQAACNPTNSTFWEEEYALRKAVGFPPFGTLITLTAEATPAALSKLMDPLLDLLTPFTPRILPDRVGFGSHVRRTIVLSLPEGTWPKKELGQLLCALPPSIRVRIDPEAL